jgi:DNA-binding transcriptional LysR family regulator
MDLRQLRYFLTLSEELHFRRAAERLNITQAPLSIAIQSLEREVGARLFHRTQRRVALTDVGAAFRAHAAAILASVDRALDDVKQMAAGEVGRLRLGFTGAAPLLPFFPQVIREFRTRYPKVVLTLHEISSLGQIAALELRDIDVGLIRTVLPPERSDIVFTRLLADRLVVAMHVDHPLAAEADMCLAKLRDWPLVFYPRKSGIGIFDHVMRLCAEQGFSPNIVQEARESSTIISLAASGLGVAIVPAELACINVPNVSFRPLSDPAAVAQLVLASRAGEESTPVANFRRMARSAIAEGGNAGE